MPESAFFQARAYGSYWSVQNVLKRGDFDSSLRINLKGCFILLFVEYGHRLPCNCYINDCEVLQTYLEHDLMPLNEYLLDYFSRSYNLNRKLDQCRLVHNLLRQYGEFHARMCSTMLYWMVDDGILALCDDPRLNDLREALVYAVEETEVLEAALIVLQLLRKDWFLLYLRSVSLDVKTIIPRLYPFIECGSLRFMVEECQADINAVDRETGQTFLQRAWTDSLCSTQSLQFFLDLGADINIAGSDSLTLLDDAVTKVEVYRASGYKLVAWNNVAMLPVSALRLGRRQATVTVTYCTWLKMKTNRK